MTNGTGTVLVLGGTGKTGRRRSAGEPIAGGEVIVRMPISRRARGAPDRRLLSPR